METEPLVGVRTQGAVNIKAGASMMENGTRWPVCITCQPMTQAAASTTEAHLAPPIQFVLRVSHGELFNVGHVASMPHGPADTRREPLEINGSSLQHRAT
jgi:hypothetical protein